MDCGAQNEPHGQKVIAGLYFTSRILS